MKERVIIYEIDIEERMNINFNKMTVEIIEEANRNNFDRLDIYNEYFEIMGNETLELDINVIFSIPISKIYDKITDDGLIPITIRDVDILIVPVTRAVRRKLVFDRYIWQVNLYTVLARYGAVVKGGELIEGFETYDRRFLYQAFYKHNTLGIRIKKL